MTLRKKSIFPNAPLSISSPPREPVWKGPLVDGVTQTMLSRYLVCPERFRVLYIEGLQPVPKFHAELEFGNLWHAAEEAFARHGDSSDPFAIASEAAWQRAVYDYANKLGELYPFQRDQIIHWLQIIVTLFPIYIEYWENHQDVVDRNPLLQEQPFDVSYKLPSGREVKLRGKWDSNDAVNSDMRMVKGIWVQENKSKSQIDREKITRQLKHDLQTMLYLIAQESYENEEFWEKARKALPGMGRKPPIRGVRYNVVRRPAHKIIDNLVKTARKDIAEGNAEEWFARWNVEVSANDIASFKRWTLDPILDNLCDDYEWWQACYGMGIKLPTTSALFDHKKRHEMFPHHQRRHYIMPFIGYNPLAEGRETDVDNYLFTGNEIGLQRITHDDLFPELSS